jgi:hypothetical protein
VDLYSRGCGSFKHLRPLTFLFLTKPTLAQHVRHFTLRDPFSKARPNGNETQISDVRGALEEAIFAGSHSAEEFRKWIIGVVSDQPDAILAVLLPTMIRLEKLDLMLRSNYPYFDQMIIRAITKEIPFDRQPLFAEITAFMYTTSWKIDHKFGRRDPPWKNQPVRSNYAILFPNFPRIRSIFGHGTWDYDECERHPYDGIIGDTFPTCDDYPTFDNTRSSLTHLELKSSIVVLRNLYAMVEIPKALLTFIYEMNPIQRPLWDCLTDILLALAPLRSSLENLWLDCPSPNVMDFQFYNQTYHKLYALAKFTHLKNLRVSGVILSRLLEEDK